MSDFISDKMPADKNNHRPTNYKLFYISCISEFTAYAVFNTHSAWNYFRISLVFLFCFFTLPQTNTRTGWRCAVDVRWRGKKNNLPYLFEQNELNSFNFTLLRPALLLTLREKGRHPASVLLPFSENIKSKSDDAHVYFLPKQSPPMRLFYSSHTSVTNLPSGDDEWLIKVDQVNLLQLID